MRRYSQRRSPYTTADLLSLPQFQANGATPLGEAILKSIQLMEERVADYRAHGIPNYIGWQFVLSDGASTDDIEPAIRAVRRGEQNRSFVFFAVGVDGADMNELARFSAVRPPLYLKNTATFSQLFLWLSASLKSVSRSSPSQSVPLSNPTAPGGWGQAPS